MHQVAETPGLDVPIERVRQIRLQLADHGHAVSYRNEGRPFLPTSKGYNRDDDHDLLAVPAEFVALAPFVMRHRLGGGRIEVLHDGLVMCDRCGEKFATLVGGTGGPGAVMACTEDFDRDPEEVRATRARSRANDNLEAILAAVAALNVGTQDPADAGGNGRS